jgi:hypothetical protein
MGQHGLENAISIARPDSIPYDSNFQPDYDDNALGHNYDAVDHPQTVIEDSLRIRSTDFNTTPTAFHLNELAENGSSHSQPGSLGPSRMSDIGTSSSHSFASPS